jgi:hypothetical protein
VEIDGVPVLRRSDMVLVHTYTYARTHPHTHTHKQKPHAYTHRRCKAVKWGTPWIWLYSDRPPHTRCLFVLCANTNCVCFVC